MVTLNVSLVVQPISPPAQFHVPASFTRILSSTIVELVKLDSLHPVLKLGAAKDYRNILSWRFSGHNAFLRARTHLGGGHTCCHCPQVARKPDF